MYNPRPGTLTVAAKSELVDSFTDDHDFGDSGTFKGVTISASSDSATITVRFRNDSADKTIPLSAGIHTLPWWLTAIKAAGTADISYVLGYLE